MHFPNKNVLFKKIKNNLKPKSLLLNDILLVKN